MPPELLFPPGSEKCKTTIPFSEPNAFPTPSPKFNIFISDEYQFEDHPALGQSVHERLGL